MRQVARDPEQLELERERERVEGWARRARAGLVQRVEEARQRDERAVVALLLGEEAEHRLGADQPDAQAVGLLANRAVRPYEVDSRHRLELARALVQLQRNVRQRLEPAAEAGLRLPDPLGDGADPAAILRVQVNDPVRLAEPQRAKDDRFGRVRAGHVSSLESGPAGTSGVLSSL